MSTTFAPGTTQLKDPNDAMLFRFDFDERLAAGVEISTKTLSCSTIVGDATPLTVSTGTLVTGNRKVDVLVSAGTVGKVYTVTCVIVTNESPAQTLERHFKVQIRH